MTHIGVLISLFNSCTQGICLTGTNTPREEFVDIFLHHRRETAQLRLDPLGLLHQHFHDPILRSLRQHKVVAAHFGIPLQFTVNPPIALFHAARIPGHIKVK